ncbi:centrosomal protein 15 [Pseudophryne corroboree]|uniref:centrosomal protein 15 n=1 Tax=Pseudophryne corroboree TaxID=495146 RepID=UPI0030817878
MPDGQGGCEESLTLYSAREEELEKMHKAIIADKHKLYEEMKIHNGQQLAEPYIQASEAAHRRNQGILEDLQIAEKTLRRRSHVSPDRAVVELENLYWASVEEELPKWEQFLLGKAQLPFGMKQIHQPKQKLKHSQTLQTPKRKNLPPSGFNSNTFPK